jgi:hypothetical protein
VEKMTKISTLVLVALALSLAVAPAASAQATLDGYSDVGGTVQDKVNPPDGGTAGTQESGDEAPSDEAPSSDVASDVVSSDDSLPFTGLDVALLVAAGGLFLVLGFGMRRLTRSTT